MDIQVVHHQADGLGFRILQGQVEGYLRELKRRAVRRGEGEVPARPFESPLARGDGRASEWLGESTE